MSVVLPIVEPVSHSWLRFLQGIWQVIDMIVWAVLAEREYFRCA